VAFFIPKEHQMLDLQEACARSLAIQAEFHAAAEARKAADALAASTAAFKPRTKKSKAERRLAALANYEQFLTTWDYVPGRPLWMHAAVWSARLVDTTITRDNQDRVVVEGLGDNGHRCRRIVGHMDALGMNGAIPGKMPVIDKGVRTMVDIVYLCSGSAKMPPGQFAPTVCGCPELALLCYGDSGYEPDKEAYKLKAAAALQLWWSSPAIDPGWLRQQITR
jgi:hypothetical protein